MRSFDRDPDKDKLSWSISGCQDHQTSADATINGQRQGAMTWALLESLSEGGFRGPWTYKYENLILCMKKKMRGKYEQIPVLSTTNENLLSKQYLAKG
jgi:hypothetical protein